MNTRILYIDGRRMPQGLIVEFKVTGPATERGLMVLIDELKKIPVKGDICVDEFNIGRLQARYEWNSRDKVHGAPRKMTTVKGSTTVECTAYPLLPVTTDSFTR